MIFDELRNIEEKHGYLPADQLRVLSDRAKVPLYRIHSVASFYPHFSLTPQPSVTIGVCSDLSCHLRGAASLEHEIRQRSGLNEYAVKPVSCLGQCERAPAIAVNGHIFSHATADRAEVLISMAQADRDLADEAEADESTTPCRAVAGPVCDGSRLRFASDPYKDAERYGVLRNLVRTPDWDGVIRALKQAGTVGMGGAGFPAHIKWDVVRRTPGAEKYVVCNADESEPGTTKDRAILEFLPHLVIEGMIVCGLVTGARHGYLYIRHEYDRQRRILEAEIERCRERGLLGRRILETDLSFEIDLFVSPGGYICGEGSALLEAIEGNRAEPRLRPPNTATHGLWQKPTALNNVETFLQVPQVLARTTQTGDSPAGLKFVTVSGDVRNPGVFEVRLGTPISDIILGHAGGSHDGKKVKAFAPSGAAAGFVPASFMDLRLDFSSMAAAGTMLGSGAIVVCAEGRCMVDMALNAVRFFRNESCGKCVPCRIGSEKMLQLVDGWTRGEGRAEDIVLVEELAATLKLTSICGRGQFIPFAVLTVFEHFRAEAEAHILEHICPEGVCPMRG